MNLILKKISVLFTLYRITSIQKIIFILYHSFFRNDLDTKSPEFHRLLIFVNNCIEQNYAVTNLSQELLILSLSENRTRIRCILRKYTRDLLVAHQVFIQRDYLPLVNQDNCFSKKMLIIDAGANIGCATLYLKAYFKNAKIICVEPEKSNFEILKQNISMNNSSDIQFLNKALWNNSVSSLNLRKRDESTDAYHVMEKEILDDIVDQVETCTVSDLLLDIEENQIDIFKMDIEGAEKTLFEDKKCIDSFLPISKCIALEVHEEFISEKEVLNILKKYNFQSFKNGEYIISNKILEK